MFCQNKTLATVQDRIAELTKDKRVNGQKFHPLYLGDHSPRKKIMSKEDLEDEMSEDDLDYYEDKEFLKIDMKNQR